MTDEIEVFDDWCKAPTHGESTRPLLCAHIGGVAICLEFCLVSLMEQNGYRRIARRRNSA